MGLLDKEEVVAPTQSAAVSAAIVTKGTACTRDTRGDAPCAIKDCENCN
jgi:hypothetical protein